MARRDYLLPVETEERVKRRALNVCLESLRKVVELTRKVPQLADFFLKNDTENANRLLSEIKSGEEDVVKARQFVSKELAEIGAVLGSREDFLRFSNLTSEIADSSEGIAYRVIDIMNHKWNVTSEIKKDLLTLSESVFETVLKLREAMLVLNYGSAQTLEKVKDVEISERKVDDLYRVVQLKLLTSKLDIPVLLLLNDVLKMFENCADKAEDAADELRILSFII